MSETAALVRPLPRLADLFRLPGATPAQFYCVLERPGLLAGMSYPHLSAADWKALGARGFTQVICLAQSGIRYDPFPLRATAYPLEDLAGGRLPGEPEEEACMLRVAAGIVRDELEAAGGVVVHCDSGTGRTGTVLGCALHALGYSFEEVLAHLHQVNAWRDKTTVGWPESPWQEEMLRLIGA